jgi:hypothetical protein
VEIFLKFTCTLDGNMSGMVLSKRSNHEIRGAGVGVGCLKVVFSSGELPNQRKVFKGYLQAAAKFGF